MKRAWAFVTIALLGLAGSAHAETPPSAWDRAKRPEVEDEYQLHLVVRQILDLQKETDMPALQLANEAQNMRVLAMLQSAGAAKSTNPLLRYDLADAYMRMQMFPQAVATFKQAAQDFPDAPQTRRSRFDFAIACAHMADHDCEQRLYREVIARSTTPSESVTPLMNLAETEMHNHDLKASIEDYREALRLCGFFTAGPEKPALILWGLAVALDRAGETREAEESAHRALEMVLHHIELLRSDGVFFVPEYEVLWYEALTYAAAAKHATTPQRRLDNWLQAERRMTGWITGAEKKKDYWLPIAKARVATYAKERKAAEAAALKGAPRHEDEGDAAIPPMQPPPVIPAPVVPPKKRPPLPPPPPVSPGGNVTL